MRIQGEPLKLGISVSATTIASALRASSLGPASRRIGPLKRTARSAGSELCGRDDSLDTATARESNFQSVPALPAARHTLTECEP